MGKWTELLSKTALELTPVHPDYDDGVEPEEATSAGDRAEDEAFKKLEKEIDNANNTNETVKEHNNNESTDESREEAEGTGV